jgi:8-oxo-dGTP diphosphatase
MEEALKIVYAQSPLPTSVTKTLYLAGPTDRNLRPTAWRQEALQILRDLAFDGHVFVPELEGNQWNGNRDAQFEWEHSAMSRADALVFWVPRDLHALPGFTTNLEWGLYANSGRVVLGIPEGTPKTDWMERYAESFQVPVVRDLKYALRIAREHIIGSGAYREGADVRTPLRQWRAQQKAPVVYPKPSLTADNAVFSGEDVLLVLRGDDPFKGFWALPGGYVNEGEEPVEAAPRELKEEATLDSGSLRLVGIYGKKGRDPRGWVVSTAYLSEATSRTVKGNDDVVDAKWFPVKDALAMTLAFDHSTILQDAVALRSSQR